MNLICPTCKTHATDFERGSVFGILKCENENCYTYTQNNSKARNYISIKNISSLSLSYYNLYLLDDKDTEKIWRLYGNIEAVKTELFKIKYISFSANFNNTGIGFYGSYPTTINSSSMTGGSITITGGNGAAINGNGGAVKITAGTSGGVPPPVPIISVPFIEISLENFHLNVNHILKRLQNLAIFS